MTRQTLSPNPKTFGGVLQTYWGKVCSSQNQMLISDSAVSWYRDLFLSSSSISNCPIPESFLWSTADKGSRAYFWERSNKLRDIWLDDIKSASEGSTVINVLPWLSRATLDIIGVAGFDYHFNSLEDEKDELSTAFMKVFEAGQQFSMLTIIRSFIPFLRFLQNERSRGLAVSMATMRRIGMKLINEKKEALTQDFKTGSTTHGRDLLTLLIKSNGLRKRGPEDVRRRGTWPYDDFIEISTFLTAGHETTSTSTTWALYALAKHPNVQQKLRQEIIEAGLGDEPSMAELDKLPYLDKVIRECLRVHPAVPSTVREATGEINIPLSQSLKDKRAFRGTMSRN
ncbi:cytochrome P450 family protein [Ceratobasidium sp. AG-Ba]|nr:cytochrome P450 family protein [Ceratobasidium sp. AG-Ba]